MQRLLSRTEIPDSPTSEENSQVLCYYKNTTCQIQISRISNLGNCYFERVVFPQEQFLFEALPEAELEINTSTKSGATLSDKILCSRLQVRG